MEAAESGASQSGSPENPKESSDLKAYRDWLIKADYEASEAYDKAIMTLSGGALAISITFIHDIAPSPKPATVYWLAIAWCAFGLSVALSLISKLTSQWALRKAIDQTDSLTIYDQSPGAGFSDVTKYLNIIAGMAFLIGVGTLARFAVLNVALSGLSLLFR